MLSEALNASGLAGRVEEYFHALKLEENGNPERSKDAMLAYYSSVVASSSTANGVFGMKLHYNQFDGVFGRNGLGAKSGVNFVRSFDRHVLIYRRDKVLQSISELLATKSGLWNTGERQAAGSLGGEFDVFDIPLLMKMMSRQVAEEYAWRSLMQELSIGFLEVAYEDLLADPQTELARLVTYLGIPGLTKLDLTDATVKLTDPAATQAIRQKVLLALGVAPA